MGSDGADWSLITVTYNSAEHLRACWGAADFGAARWIVVDNGSSDGSAQVARDLGASEVVEQQTNRGFSAGNNVGLSRVTTPWVAFVNPDVVIDGPAGLNRLAQTLTQTGGLVAPQLLNSDGSEQMNGRGVPIPTHKLANRGLRLHGVDPRQYAQAGFSSPTYVAWAMGAALAGSTSLVRGLGGWDENYFIYYEDHEIGLRSWRAGHPVLIDPVVRWVHMWARATTRLRWQPWRREFQAMHRFYSTYPGLRTAGAFRRLRRNTDWVRAMDEKLWMAYCPRDGEQCTLGRDHDGPA